MHKNQKQKKSLKQNQSYKKKQAELIYKSAKVNSVVQLGAALRRFRKLQKMSQSTLSEKAGVTQKTISKIENDGNKTTIETLMLVLAALRVDLNLSEKRKNDEDDLKGLY